MALRLALPLLLALPALAAGVPNPLTGIVEKISGSTIQVKSGREVLTFSSCAATVIYRNGTFRDLAILRKGEPVRLSWQGDMLAVAISTEIAISGTVQFSKAKRFELRSSAGNEVRMIELTPGTTFSTDHPDLSVGQDVHVTGWDTGDGWVEARRVAVYNTDLPVDVPPLR